MAYERRIPMVKRKICEYRIGGFCQKLMIPCHRKREPCKGRNGNMSDPERHGGDGMEKKIIRY